MATRTRAPLLLLVGTTMWSACDLSEPVLEDERSGASDSGMPPEPDPSFDETCASLEQCCDLPVPACVQELAKYTSTLEWAVEYAGTLGVVAARDEACPLLPVDVEVGATCDAAAECVAPCKPYVGTVGAGGACQSFDDIDDCAQGLLCFGSSDGSGTGLRTGVCAEPCDRIGQACSDADGLYPSGGRYLSKGSWSCGPVAYCDETNGPGVCAPVRHDDEACPDGTGCADGLFCELGTCAPQVGEGQACTSTAACVDGNLCDGSTGTCVREWDALDATAPLGCAWALTYGIEGT